MVKILQASLQQYMNCELLDVQAGFMRTQGSWGNSLSQTNLVMKSWVDTWCILGFFEYRREYRLEMETRLLNGFWSLSKVRVEGHPLCYLPFCLCLSLHSLSPSPSILRQECCQAVVWISQPLLL